MEHLLPPTPTWPPCSSATTGICWTGWRDIANGGPDGWAHRRTGPGLTSVVRSLAGSVLLDSLGTWVAAQARMAPWTVRRSVARLSSARRQCRGVEEVGLGVHPLLPRSDTSATRWASSIKMWRRWRSGAADSGRPGPPATTARPDMRAALAFLTAVSRSAPTDAACVALVPARGRVLGLALGGLWWAAGENLALAGGRVHCGARRPGTEPGCCTGRVGRHRRRLACLT